MGWKSMAGALGVVALAAIGGFMPFQAASGAAEPAVVIPAPVVDLQPGDGMAVAVLAGGCFWGVQGVFQHVTGVTRAVSGYAGGEADTAFYEQVGSGATGHAESVEVTYDPHQISFGEILQIYFSVAHNPTQLNYQGPDYGPQYRSTIFVSDPEQKSVAEAYIAQLNAAKVFPEPVVTTIEPLKKFYAAEQYHQDYLTLHPQQPYIAVNDLPKIDNLKALFPTEYRAEPVLVGKL